MAQFVFVYLGGNQPSGPEEANKHFSKYMEWLSSLGDSVVIPTIPLKDTNTINPDGTIREGGSSAMSGFSIIKAESMEAALSIAQSCPFLEIGGSLEVSEMMQIPVQ
ncbi:MAG: YciI family protein [Gammaproteobacteria bacterium]|nr:YciI family protein [Gammaproteobacteria bacterium]